MTDEIIEELWKIKDDMAREHDYDLDTLVADLRLRLREQYPSQFNHDIDETYKDIVSMPNPSLTSSRFKVAEALVRDVGRAVARPNPDDMRTLGLAIGDFVAVTGKSGTLCKVLPAHKEARGQTQIQLDGLTRGNAGVSLGETVVLWATACEPARQVELGPIDTTPQERDLPYISCQLSVATAPCPLSTAP